MSPIDEVFHEPGYITRICRWTQYDPICFTDFLRKDLRIIVKVAGTGSIAGTASGAVRHFDASEIIEIHFHITFFNSVSILWRTVAVVPLFLGLPLKISTFIFSLQTTHLCIFEKEDTMEKKVRKQIFSKIHNLVFMCTFWRGITWKKAAIHPPSGQSRRSQMHY